MCGGTPHVSFGVCYYILMIAQLQGTITYKGPSFIILETGGVGYKVATLNTVLGAAKENAVIFLWTHLAVREDAMELYGFSSKQELDFFEMLVAISGIGPKSGLAILNLAPVEQLTKAIRAGDAHYLTKVSGIGKKTSAKIIFELKEKFGRAEEVGGNSSLKEEVEALEALQSLGYTLEEAREALKNVGDKAHTTHEKIKMALRSLARQ